VGSQLRVRQANGMTKKKPAARFPYQKKQPRSPEPKVAFTLAPSVSRLRTIEEACLALGVSRSSFIIAAAYDRAVAFLEGRKKNKGVADPYEIIKRTDKALQAWRDAFGTTPPTDFSE
jgi:hypothetical protein